MSVDGPESVHILTKRSTVDKGKLGPVFPLEFRGHAVLAFWFAWLFSQTLLFRLISLDRQRCDFQVVGSKDNLSEALY